MNFEKLLRLKQARDVFFSNHPKFPAFLNALRTKGITENTEILISVTYPNGENLKAGLKLKQSDLELLGLFGELTKE